MNPSHNPFGAPEGPLFGGGVTESVIHPLVFAVLVVIAVLTLVLPRRHVLGPIMCGVLLVPLGQQLVALGVHWQVQRILILVALVRVLLSAAISQQPFIRGTLTAIDRAFFLTIASEVAAVILRNRLDTTALINQVAFAQDFALTYLVIRHFYDGVEGLYRSLKWMAVITAILAAGMIVEQVALRNLFGEFGGTLAVPLVREGKIRSQGAFQHAITAGVFGAVLIPQFVLLWKHGGSRILAAVGLCGATVMTLCSASSTPLLAYAVAVSALGLWPLRRHMRTLRWGFLGLLISLQLVMKAPVWFLIARIDLAGGSSGYHRALLVDQFVTRLGEWWLFGTSEAATWGYDMWDQQNQFVAIGVTGGLVAFASFIATITHAWRLLGVARHKAEHSEAESLFWLLGVSLFANVVAFFGANLYDQSKFGWFMLLAGVSAVTGPLARTAAEPAGVAGRAAERRAVATWNWPSPVPSPLPQVRFQFSRPLRRPPAKGA